MTGLLALLGGQEHTDGCEAMDSRIVDEVGRSAPTVAVVLAATTPRRRAFKINEARTYWRRFGVRVRFAMAGGADELERSLDTLHDPDVVVLCGGHPWLLHARLDNSPVRDRILRLWHGGVPLVGSSAGAMALCQWRQMLRPPAPLRMVHGAFGVLRDSAASPHYDRYGLSLWARRVSIAHPRLRVLGLTDRTALVGRGEEFTVYGPGRATLLQGGRETHVTAGGRLHLPSSQGQVAADLAFRRADRVARRSVSAGLRAGEAGATRRA